MEEEQEAVAAVLSGGPADPVCSLKKMLRHVSLCSCRSPVLLRHPDVSHFCSSGLQLRLNRSRFPIGPLTLAEQTGSQSRVRFLALLSRHFLVQYLWFRVAHGSLGRKWAGFYDWQRWRTLSGGSSASLVCWMFSNCVLMGNIQMFYVNDQIMTENLKFWIISKTKQQIQTPVWLQSHYTGLAGVVMD